MFGHAGSCGLQVTWPSSQRLLEDPVEAPKVGFLVNGHS